MNQTSCTFFWIGAHGALKLFALEYRSSFTNLINEWLDFCYKQRTSFKPSVVFYFVGMAPTDPSKRDVSNQEIADISDRRVSHIVIQFLLFFAVCYCHLTGLSLKD